jgi:hypothetical protein
MLEEYFTAYLSTAIIPEVHGSGWACIVMHSNAFRLDGMQRG